MRQQFSIPSPIRAAACAALLLLAALPSVAQQLAADAPERYTVQKGDTLWGISGKFLKDPWRWPEVWRLNREQVKNPHWIYPGDVIVLDRSGGQVSLRLERGGQTVSATAPPGGAPSTPPPVAAPATPPTAVVRPAPGAAESSSTVRLSPSVRVVPLDAAAVSSIPPTDLEPFLRHPLVTGPDGLANAAYVVAGRDEHVVRGQRDLIYATGIDGQAGALWNIYRPGRVFVSPENRKEVLGYEQRFLGTARIDRFADISSLRIETAHEEIMLGDRLIPAPRGQLVNYAPHPPGTEIVGNVLATEDNSAEAGVGWVVTVDKGARDGIDVGTVLATYRRAPSVPDPRPPPESNWLQRYYQDTEMYRSRHMLTLPEERTGLVFVYLVYDRVSYAIAMRTTDPIITGDYVRSP